MKLWTGHFDPLTAAVTLVIAPVFLFLLRLMTEKQPAESRAGALESPGAHYWTAGLTKLPIKI
jgi:hypothetical protein